LNFLLGAVASGAGPTPGRRLRGSTGRRAGWRKCAVARLVAGRCCCRCRGRCRRGRWPVFSAVTRG